MRLVAQPYGTLWGKTCLPMTCAKSHMMFRVYKVVLLFQNCFNTLSTKS